MAPGEKDRLAAGPDGKHFDEVDDAVGYAMKELPLAQRAGAWIIRADGQPDMQLEEIECHYRMVQGQAGS